jgi:hypothetical protein
MPTQRPTPLPNYPQPRSGPTWFRSLARPQLGLSGLGLLGFLTLAWQFSQRPDWQQALAFKSASPGPVATDSAENQAFTSGGSENIGADIDSLAALNADLGRTPAGLLDPKANRNDPLAPLKATEKAAAADGKLNPLSLETLLGGLPSGLPSGDKGALSSSLTGGMGSLMGTSAGKPAGLNAPGFNFSSGLNSSTSLANRNSTSSSNSLLDSALNRYSPARPNPNAPFAVKPSEPTPTATPTVKPIAGTSGFEPTAVPTAPSNPIAGTSTVNPALLANPNPGLNSYTGLTNGGVPALPDAAPTYSNQRDIGVAAPSAILRSPSNMPVPIGSTPMPPGGASESVTITVPQPDRPFSVPRSAPGQSMGGGEIRTFSNP